MKSGTPGKGNTLRPQNRTCLQWTMLHPDQCCPGVIVIGLTLVPVFRRQLSIQSNIVLTEQRFVRDGGNQSQIKLICEFEIGRSWQW